MIVRSSNMAREKKSNFKGGKGEFTIGYLLKDETRVSGTTKIMIVEVPPFSSIGYHQHTDDEEIYYILRGKGVANDNGDTVELHPGDAMITRKGEYHGIENRSEETLVFLAIINKT